MKRTPQNIEAMKKIAWVKCDRCETWVYCVYANLREQDVEDTTLFCV